MGMGMKTKDAHKGRRGVRPKRIARAKCSRRSRIKSITAQTQEQNILRGSEAHFRGLTEDIPQLVWSSNPEGECDYISPQWTDYSGLPTEKLLGKGWVNVIHPDDRPHAWEVCNAAKANGENFLLEYRLRNAQGHYRWFKVAALPLRDPKGQLTKWFGTCTDIDDQKNYATR